MSVSTALEGHFGVITTPQSVFDATDEDVKSGLAEAVVAADAEPDLHAVILHIVGQHDSDGAPAVFSYEQNPTTPYLADIVAQIEASTKPWIAVLHGAINGPNLELALGCHARVSGADTVFTMPQMPTNNGAAVRLPRLVGPLVALDMLLSDASVTAANAEAAGLIDLVMDDDVHGAAAAFAMGMMAGELPVPTSQGPVPSFDQTVWQQRLDDLDATRDVTRLAVSKAVDHGLSHPGRAGLAGERLIFLAHKHRRD